MRVFVTGGTGLVGGHLVPLLTDRGDQPVVLTRNKAAAIDRFQPAVELVEGDPTVRGPWQDVVGACDAVVNLAGENVFARRWNDAFKAKIRDSRVSGTRHVVEAMQRAKKPATLVNASAIGYYGPHGDELLTEESPPGNDFLARVCVEWEEAARALGSAGRLVIIRVGVVLDPKAGALAQMLTPFKLGVGGPVGSGRQWMSWIHATDLARMILYALDQAAVAGAVNGVAPDPVTNKEFSRSLGRALGRPSFMPVPVFMLRVRFGQVAEVIASGQRIVPKRMLDLGFQFRFRTIDEALTDLLQ